MINVKPVILCGGSGSRLWPLSRSGFPKQFLCLVGNESLFQEAVKRLKGLVGNRVDVGLPFIVTNEEHRFLVQEQLREIDVELGAVLLEPVARNTAPALTLAALAAVEYGDDPVLVVTPSDQRIADVDAFKLSMHDAICRASEGGIVILGVTADRPETGYSYIQTATSTSASFAVERFVEKPDEATAEQFLADGGYFWNAGIYVLKASTWLQAIELYRPDIAAATRTAWACRSCDAAIIRPGKAEFAAIPSGSIDNAVIESYPLSDAHMTMVPLEAGWCDLGAWDAVWGAMQKDERGNAHLGDVVAINSRNTLVNASSRLVTLVGVEGLVVVETPDAVLVADRSRSQSVKDLVVVLQQQKREIHNVHRKAHRPWGWYDILDEGGRFKVKRLQVEPKASLSLQKHHHRAEHWIVIQGTAEITIGGEKLTLTENQSTYIPFGEVHRLSNPGMIPLEIIEVQSGSYLGEDDIVRFEDTYGRNQ